MEIPTSETSSDAPYMSRMSLTLKSDSTWNFLTAVPLGVMTMFFLTRYMSMSGWMILLWRRMALASSLFLLPSPLDVTMVSTNATMNTMASTLQNRLFR